MRTGLFLVALIGMGGVFLNLSTRTTDAQNKSPSVPWQSPEQRRWFELSQQASLAATRYYYSEAEALHKQAIRVAERWGTKQGKLNKYVSLYNLGGLYMQWGKYPQAETSFRQALQLIEKLDGSPNSRSRNVLHALAKACWQQGKRKEAKGYLERALALGSKNPDEETTAILLYELAVLCEQLGQSSLAKSYREQLLKVEPREPNQDTERLLNRLESDVMLHEIQRRYTEAEALALRALAITEAAWGPQHPEVAKALHRLALILNEQGRYGEAEPLLKRALAIREKAFGADHREVATSLDPYAALLRKTGRATQAEQMEERAEQIMQAYRQRHPQQLAMSSAAPLSPEEQRWWKHVNAGFTALRARRLPEAERELLQALQLAEQMSKKREDYLIQSLEHLTSLALQKQQFKEAETYCQKALAIAEKAWGKDRSRLVHILDRLAQVYKLRNKPRDAERLYQRAFSILEHEPWSFQKTSIAYELGVLKASQREFKQAERYLKQALSDLKQKYYARDWQAKVLTSLASLYTRWGRLAQAESLFQRALPIYEEMTPDTKQQFLQAIEFYEQYAFLLKKTGETAQASRFEKRAQDLRTALTHLEKENGW